MFGLDSECMSTEIVPLRLQEICWEVLRAIPIVPAESRAKSRRRYTPQCPLADDVSPTILSLVDGFVEEIVKQQVLKVRVLTICRCDVLQEHRSNNAATTPHQCNRRFVELPFVLYGSLNMS